MIPLTFLLAILVFLFGKSGISVTLASLIIFLLGQKITHNTALRKTQKILLILSLPLFLGTSIVQTSGLDIGEFSEQTLEYVQFLHQFCTSLLILSGLLFAANFSKKDLPEDSESEQISPQGAPRKTFRALKNILIIAPSLAIFTLITSPYWEYSFAGAHLEKYNTYVGTAVQMYREGNPFLNRKRYAANPVTNPAGNIFDFKSAPLLEWSLLGAYTLFPEQSFEWNTRMAVHFWGCLFLIFFFCTISQISSKEIAGISTFLLAINPIINFVYFVTVYDGVAFVFCLLSLLMISHAKAKKRPKIIFLAALIGGIGITAKLSVILILPWIALFLLLQNNKWSFSVPFWRDCFFYFPTLLIPHILARQSLRWLPSEPNEAIFKFFLGSTLLVLIYRNIEILDQKIAKPLCQKIQAQVRLLLLAGVLCTILGIVLYNLLNFGEFSSEFLTDMSLVFEYKMYHFMLFEQFQAYMTPFVFWLGVFGFGLLLIRKTMFQKHKVLLGFFVAMIFYWVAAAKVIFFHEYYTVIMMMSFALFAALTLSSVLRTFTSPIGKTIVLGMILLTLALPSISLAQSERFLEKQKVGARAAAQYLQEQTRPEDLFIREATTTLGIYANRGSLLVSVLEQPEVKASIQEIGFQQTMGRYNIRYVITFNEPDYEKYANLFSEQDLQRTAYRRSDIILSQLYTDRSYFADQSIRADIVEIFDVKNLFEFETQVGDYRFYRFKEET